MILYRQVWVPVFGFLVLSLDAWFGGQFVLQYKTLWRRCIRLTWVLIGMDLGGFGELFGRCCGVCDG